MNRAKFYGQQAFDRPNMSTSLNSMALNPRLPQGPRVTMTDFSLGDFFTDRRNVSLSEALGQELSTINRRESDLKKKIASTPADQMTEAMRQEIMMEQSMIERARKMLTYLAETMRSCQQTISNNFR